MADPDEALAAVPSAKQAVQGQKKLGRSKEAQIRSGVLSPTQVARGIEPYEKIVDLTKAARRKANELADRWVTQAGEIRSLAGSDKEFSRVLRAYENGQPLGTTPEIEKLVTTMFQEMHDSVGTFGQTQLFREGFVRRLRQNVKVHNGDLVPDEYISEDVRNIAPGKKGDEFIKQRLGKDISDAEAYSFDGATRYLRSLARQAALGTETSPGYLRDIRPLIKEMNAWPDLAREDAQAYVNYFLGVPGYRSAPSTAAWADRIKKYQFIRTLGANPLAAVTNLTQQTITMAETSLPAFLKAHQDVYKFYRGNAPEIEKLLDKAGLRHELASSGVMADYASAPTELMGRFDKALEKGASVLGAPFRFTERTNRTHAFLAGFNDAIRKGMSEDEAIAYGKKIMDKTQFTGGEADLPRLYRKGAGSVIGQYKTFPTKYAEYVTNMGDDLVKSWGTPAFKDEAARAAKFWVSQIAIGGTGAVALPLYGDWLEKLTGRLPADAQKGLGGLIGAELSHIVGTGVLPIEDGREMIFSLKGPAVNMAQDVFKLGIAGLAAATDQGKVIEQKIYDKPISEDDLIRTLTRVMPAGSQANRIREMARLIQTGGVSFASTDFMEALGLTPATGAKQSEVELGPAAVGMVGFGLRPMDKERESDLRDRESLRDRIKRNAMFEAAEAVAAGKNAEAILQRADAALRAAGFDEEPLRLSDRGIQDAGRRRNESVTERQRRMKGERGIRVPAVGE